MKKTVKILLLLISIFIFTINKIQPKALLNSDKEWMSYSFENDTNVISLNFENDNRFSNVNFIYNYNYFLSNPLYATNDKEQYPYGTCSTIAMQMLLGYHNYYSDRRIIPEFDENNERFLSEEYGKIEFNPDLIFSGSTYGNKDRHKIGTLDRVYEKLLELNPNEEVTFLGQNVSYVASAGNSFINQYSSCDSDTISIEGGIFSSSEAIEQINKGNPIILGMAVYNEDLDKITFHVVTAFGYAYYNGNLGFIVNFGTEAFRASTWVPVDYFAFKIKMEVNHTHNFINNNVLLSDIYENKCYYEIECTECGCILSDCIFEMNNNGNTILGIKYNNFNELIVPGVIRGVNLKSIGAYAFSDLDNITSIELPDSIEKIGKSAFQDCDNLKEIDFENNQNLTIFSEAIFKNCKSLNEITIPSNITKIEKFAFQGCENLANVDLPNGLTSIEESTFEYCKSLSTINLPNSITSIDDYSFRGCSNLMQITIPESVESIGQYAFSDCTELNNVTIEKEINDIITLGHNAFSNCINLSEIKVPANKLIKYKNANNWSTYKYKIFSDDIIYDEYYIDCKNLSNINNVEISSGYDKIIKIEIGCPKTYKFTFSSINYFDVIMSNSNYNVLSTDKTYSDNNEFMEMTVFLSKGIYFIDLYFLNNNEFGFVNINSNVAWPTTSYPVNIGENDVLLHLHKNSENNYDNFLNLDNFTTGFYYLKLVGINYIGIVENLTSTITIYNDVDKSEILCQYSMLNNGVLAVSDNNEMYIYLNESYSTVYVDIELITNNFYELKLCIAKVNESEVNIFNYANLSDKEIIQNNENSYNDYIEKVNIKQIGKFNLTFTNFTGGTYIIIEEYDIPDGEKDYRIIRMMPIDGLNKSIILEEGVYYIGYINSILTDMNEFKLIQLIDSTSNLSIYQNGGTEISINNGEESGNSITQGFTRIMYLSNNESRYNYNWYTSNENVSRITETGTLMALFVDSVISIKIMAVNKNNPSIILQKDFIIKPETNINEKIILTSQQPIIFNTTIDEYKQIDLSLIEVPINWLQYYTWSVSNSDILINQYGYVTVSDDVIKSTYTILGQYKLNPKYEINISLQII